MLQLSLNLFNLVLANPLPFLMAIGVTGFVLCCVADHIKNRELKKIIESGYGPLEPELEKLDPTQIHLVDMDSLQASADHAGPAGDKAHGRSDTNDSVPGTKNPKPPVTGLSPDTRKRVLTLTIIGYLLMIISMIVLLYLGYFDRWLPNRSPNG